MSLSSASSVVPMSKLASTDLRPRNAMHDIAAGSAVRSATALASRRWILRWDQDSGNAVGDDVRDASDVGSDDWLLLCHRLHDRQGCPLAAGRCHHDVDFLKVLKRVVELSQEPHAVTDVQARQAGAGEPRNSNRSRGQSDQAGHRLRRLADAREPRPRCPARFADEGRRSRKVEPMSAGPALDPQSTPTDSPIEPDPIRDPYDPRSVRRAEVGLEGVADHDDRMRESSVKLEDKRRQLRSRVHLAHGR